MIFSDGAGAAVLQYKEVEEDGSGILGTAALSHSLEEAYYINMDKSYFPQSDKAIRYIKMKGRKVYEYALTHVPAAMKECIDKSGIKIEDVRKFFREAKAYMNESAHTETNIKFEGVRPLFEKKQKLFIHCNQIKQMLIAVDFVKEFEINVVIVGGSDSWQIADLLKANNIAVILEREFNLPTLEDDDIDQPFKTPYLLQKAGVLYALNDNHDEARYRNLSFNAGQAVAYGLTKEEALQAITLNAAKILGVDDRTGTIEAGKDANIVISDGDILDMRTSIIIAAFIQGRNVSLKNKQTELYERYRYKYGF